MKLRWIVLLLGTCAVASAQVGEIALSFGQALFKNNQIGTDGTNNYEVRDGFHFGVRLTLNTKRFIGHEFGYAYNRGKLGLTGAPDEVTMGVHQGFYDFLLYGTPEGSRIRPFAAGGGQFSTFYPPGTSVSYGNGVTKFGLNYGGGIKVKISTIFEIRLDVRDYVMGKPLNLTGRSGPLHLVQPSAGLGFVF